MSTLTYDKAVAALYDHRVEHLFPEPGSPEWEAQRALATAARTLQVERDAELEAYHDRVAAIVREQSKARWA